MKRRRKCCCCQGEEYQIIGTFTDVPGTWNLSPWQNKKYRKYKKKYWDINQGGTVLERGRIDKNGKLVDLPNSIEVAEDANSAFAEVRVRCFEICGDDGYEGRVVATNAGIPYPWDLTSYKNSGHKGENGSWFIRFLSPSVDTGIYRQYVTFRSGSVDDGNLIDLPDLMPEIPGSPYAELGISCGVCVETAVDFESHLVGGTAEDLDGDGVFPPGASLGAVVDMWGEPIAHYVADNLGKSYPAIGSRGNCLCIPVTPSYVCNAPPSIACYRPLSYWHVECPVSGGWELDVVSELYKFELYNFYGSIDLSPSMQFIEENALPGSIVRFTGSSNTSVRCWMIDSVLAVVCPDYSIVPCQDIINNMDEPWGTCSQGNCGSGQYGRTGGNPTPQVRPEWGNNWCFKEKQETPSSSIDIAGGEWSWTRSLVSVHKDYPPPIHSAFVEIQYYKK